MTTSGVQTPASAASKPKSSYDPARSKHPQRWAARARAALLESLGGCCWACGSVLGLELDHPFGRDWNPREKSYAHRTCIYRREAAAGLLRILCSSCNGSNRFNGVVLERPRSLSELAGAEPF